MNTNPLERRARYLPRLIVLPTVVGLVSASVLVGFASGALHTKPAPVRVAQDDPTEKTPNKPSSLSDAPDRAADPVQEYKEALALVKDNYYGDPIDAKKTQQLTYAAARGMLYSLHDPFSSFLDPEEWRSMMEFTAGSFEGIGAVLQMEDNSVKIVEPIENSPAERAGIKANDVIVRVDGKPVLGKELDAVVKLIKGPHDTKVKLGIVRGKKELEFTITRDSVSKPVVKFAMEDKINKIGRIQLAEFNEKSMDAVTHAFEELRRQGMKALIFDLRGNGGGVLDVAIDIASAFIPANQSSSLGNVVVYIHSGSAPEEKRMLRPDEYMLNRLPLVVLADGTSASASEITTGAIKDYGAGTIIGERTFGKGLVQTLFPLEDHAALRLTNSAHTPPALRLTTSTYFPPKHYDINYKKDADFERVPNTGGILPDITVKQSDVWKGVKDTANDQPLQKGLAFLRARMKGLSVAQAKKQVTSK